MKPKRAYAKAILENGILPKYDGCQTPTYGLAPLIPYLDTQFDIVWECAEGEGLMTKDLLDYGFKVVHTDILTGVDFFETNVFCDVIVTNPPYSLKFDWIKRCYEIGKPWALLLPVETLGAKTSQAMFEKNGIEILLLDKRINFKMPNKGWDCQAQFPVAWFCWHILPAPIVYGHVTR